MRSSTVPARVSQSPGEALDLQLHQALGAEADHEGRVGGRRKKLDAAKRREIAESVITGRKSGADMARLYNVSQPTVSRIVAQHRMAQP
jgi:hypothetical protein